MFKIDNKIKLFAFDLDGTIYIDNKLVPGVIELLSFLKDRYQVIFFTNNSSKTTTQTHEKLNNLGVKCKLNEVYTSSSATVSYLSEAGIDNLYVIGSNEFCEEIKGQGLKVVDADSAENLVVGLDFDLNYDKIAKALTVLLKGGKFIACNKDRSFPIGNNSYLPGCGAIVGAITGSSNKEPDYIIGKPNTYILQKISDKFKVNNNEMVIVGDSYESDIIMAQNYNCKSILISKNNKSNNRILVVEDIKDIIKKIR